MTSKTIPQQPTPKVLWHILKTHPKRLALAGSLILLENGLELFYPVVAGIALDAVLAGDLPRAFVMVGIIFSFWVIGAARRSIDTRIYTKIYQELVGSIVLQERALGRSDGAVIVHAGLAQHLVDFFEVQIPAFMAALVAVVGSVVMLLFLEWPIGLLAALALLWYALSGWRMMKRSEHIATRLHNQQESEPEVVTQGSPQRIARHFHILGRRKVQLSDLEAKAYLQIGFTAALLFGALFVHLGSAGQATAGTLYMLMNYIWTLVFGLNELPLHLQQLGRVKELNQRLTPPAAA